MLASWKLTRRPISIAASLNESERGTVEPIERKQDMVSGNCASLPPAHCRSVDDVSGADLCSAAYVATNLPLISCYNTEALLQHNESDHGRLTAWERVNLSAIPNFELSLQKN